jgi:hypothetical protein
MHSMVSHKPTSFTVRYRKQAKMHNLIHKGTHASINFICLIIPATATHSAHSYTAVTLLTNFRRGIDVTPRMRRAIFYVHTVHGERCLFTAFGGGHCGNGAVVCGNKLDESILTGT